MSDKLTIGVIYGSDKAHLPETGEGFAGMMAKPVFMKYLLSFSTIPG